MKRIALAILFSLVIAPVLALPALAKGSQPDVYLPSTETVSGNYYKVGGTVEVAGKVASDVVVAGGNVIISGEVGGDVLVVGGNIRITGSVEGDVRVIGGNVELAGPVGKNVSVAAGTLTIASSSNINGHLTVAVGALDLRGAVVGGVAGAAGSVIIAGTIKGPTDIILDKEGTLQIRDTAVIQSPFKYSAYHEAQVAEGANLSEALQFNQLNLKERSWSEKFDWLRHLISLFAMLIIGMIFVVMVPKLVEQINSEALVKPWAKIGWGFVWLVVPPIAIIILAVTIIGLPLAIIGAAIYAIGLYMTQIFAGLLVGYWLKNNSKMAWWSKMSPLVMMSVGILVFKILTMLPFVGGLVVFVGLLWLWGTLASVKKQLILNYR